MSGEDDEGNYAAEQRSQEQEIGKGKKIDGVRQVRASGQYGMSTGTQKLAMRDE